METAIDEGTTPFPDEPAAASDESDREDVLAASLDVVRDLILEGRPDLIPDMVHGETLAELIQSVGPAQEAYGRIRAELAKVAPIVPAGGAGVEVIEGPGDVLIKRAIVKRRER